MPSATQHILARLPPKQTTPPNYPPGPPCGCFMQAPAPSPGVGGSAGSGDPAYNVQWKLVVQATMFVTYATVVVWSGVKSGGNDPVGTYTRVAGCDPTGTFTVEAVEPHVRIPNQSRRNVAVFSERRWPVVDVLQHRPTPAEQDCVGRYRNAMIPPMFRRTLRRRIAP